MRVGKTTALLTGLAVHGALAGTTVDPAVLDACPGYSATNVKVQGGRLTASLKLAGKTCNVFGTDIGALALEVVYETSGFQGWWAKWYTDGVTACSESSPRQNN
jgi:alpha-glucosidase